MVPSPRLFASSMAAAYTSGLAPKNLIPSAPASSIIFTHSRASSGVIIGRSKLFPNPIQAEIRGAVILFFSLSFLCRKVHSIPLPEPGSRIEVIPWASQSLYTYSGTVPCAPPPVWACISKKPGSIYIPVASITSVFSSACGRRRSLIGKPG